MFKYFLPLIFLVFSLYGGTYGTLAEDQATKNAQSQSKVKVINEEFEKSDSDMNSYRLIDMENGLRVMLISSPSSSYSAASMDVGVGHFSDPDDIPGLAHFCEHLLFMGTKKYPSENEFISYVSSNGGTTNAYTSTLDTNYYFQIPYRAFENALDIFAQFFIHPLFSSSSVEREALAVNSEHKKNIQSDLWRLYRLEQLSSRSKSVASKFGTGDYQTLITETRRRGVDVLDVLRKFHQQHYTANRMSLAVISKHTLDELQELVLKYFSEIPDRKSERPVFKEEPYTEEELGKQYWYKPVSEKTSLRMLFPISGGLNRFYKSDPYAYVTYVLAHQARGSLYRSLYDKRWAYSVWAEKDYLYSGIEIYSIYIDLTREGIENYQEVVKMFFAALQLVKDEAPKRYIGDDLINLSRTNFRFAKKQSESTIVTSLSSYLRADYIDPKHLLSVSLYREFNATHIKRLLDQMTPKNFILYLTSKDKPSSWDKKEHFYGIEYREEKMNSSFIDDLQDLETKEFKFPIANNFIAKNFIIGTPSEVKQEAPSLISNHSVFNIWYKKDDTFSSPRTYCYILFRSPIYIVNSRRYIELSFLLTMFVESLKNIFFYAHSAGNHISFQPTERGFLISIEAFTDKFYDIIFSISESFLSFEPTETLFEMTKRYYVSKFDETIKGSPRSYISSRLTFLYSQREVDMDALLYAIETITLKDLQLLRAALMKRFSVDLLAVGSLSQEFSTYVLSMFKHFYAKEVVYHQTTMSRVFSLRKNDNYIYEADVYNKDERNSAVLYSLQLGDIRDSKILAFVYVLKSIIGDFAFNQLRTKEQLGYIVRASVYLVSSILDFRVMVQSLRDPFYLEQRIVSLLYRFSAEVDTISQEDFNAYVSSNLFRLKRPYRTLEEETDTYWDEISSGLYDFNRKKRAIDALGNFTLEEYKNMYYKYIYPDSPYRKKLSVHYKSSSIGDLSVYDLSLRRLHYFLECSGILIPYDDLISLADANSRISSFKARLAKSLVEKYPNMDIQKTLDHAFTFLQTQYGKLKNEAKIKYYAEHFDDVRVFKSRLWLFPASLPVIVIKNLA